MIDCISGGRLIAGMVVGGGPEYYSFSLNPAHARERFAEAHDLILRAWTEPGPFEFIGKHYKLRYVNSWPRPIQQPHPEIWIPGVGLPRDPRVRGQAPLRLHGHPVLPHQRVRAHVRHDARGVRERGVRGRSPPAGLARADLRGRDRRRGPSALRGALLVLRPAPAPRHQHLAPRLHLGALGGEHHEERGHLRPQPRDAGTRSSRASYAIVGSPETVTELLADNVERLGVGNLLGLFQLGTLPAADTKRSLELFATEVMPKLRHAFPGGRLPGNARAGSGGQAVTALAPTTLDTAVGVVEVHRGGEGGPAPLVYLHSAQGEAPGMAMLEELADTRLVVAPLFPGFGSSEGLAHIDDIEDAAFHLLDVLDRLEFAPLRPRRPVAGRMDGGRAGRALARAGATHGARERRRPLRGRRAHHRDLRAARCPSSPPTSSPIRTSLWPS